MNSKSKIVNLGYQLVTIIIKLIFYSIFKFIIIIIYINENNNGHNYYKIVHLG